MKCCLSLFVQFWSALFDLQHRHCSKVLRFIIDIFIFVKSVYYLLFSIHPSSYLDQVWANPLLKYMNTKNIIVHNFRLRCFFWLVIVHSYTKQIKTVVAALKMKSFLKSPTLNLLTMQKFVVINLLLLCYIMCLFTHARSLFVHTWFYVSINWGKRL